MPRSGPQERPEMKTECTKLTLHGRGRPRGHWEHDAQVKHRKKEETKKLKETKQGGGRKQASPHRGKAKGKTLEGEPSTAPE